MKKAFQEKQAPAPKHVAHAEPDAVDMLTENHKQLKKLFREYQTLVEDDDDNFIRKDAVAQEACALLLIHGTLEMELFYPAAARVLHAPELIAEATVEHTACADLISQIQKTPVDDNIFDAKFIVLGEIMQMHFKKEEHEMFARMRDAKIDLKALGSKMEELRETLAVENRVADTIAEMNQQHLVKRSDKEAAVPETVIIPPPGLR